MHGDASFFCTPAHRSAQACTAGSDTGLFQASQHFPSPTQPGSAVSACLRGGTCFCCFRMRVSGPVHGMQGSWERQKLEALPKLRTSLERTYAFLGHPSWPKAATRRAMRTVRGRRPSLRDRADVVLDGSKKALSPPATHCRGGSDPQGSCYSNRSLCARSWIKDAKEMCNNIRKQPGGIIRTCCSS